MKINLNNNILELINLLHSYDAHCYITGGFVRDYIIGRESIDIDIEVHNITEEKLEEVISKEYNYHKYSRFGIYQIKSLDNLEISLPRKEYKTGNKHTDFEVIIDPNLGLKKAGLRRDFSINAIYYDLKTNELIDNFNGLEDIENKIIRHISDSFKDDQLRVLRAIRFASTLGFKIHEDTIKECLNMEISDVSQDRITQEFRKIILGDYFENGLNYLKNIIGKEYRLDRLDEINQKPNFHPEGNVWIHTIQTIKLANSINPIPEDKFILLTALLFHDIGKIKDLENKDVRHANYGFELFKEIKYKVSLSKKETKLIANLINNHMYVRNIDNMSNEEILNIVEIFEEDLKLYLYLCGFDLCGRMKNFNLEEGINKFKEYENELMSKWLVKEKNIKKLKEKYNGNYLIEKGFKNQEIGTEQRRLILSEM